MAKQMCRLWFSVHEPLYLNQCGSEQGFHDVLCDEMNQCGSEQGFHDVLCDEMNQCGSEQGFHDVFCL